MDTFSLTAQSFFLSNLFALTRTHVNQKRSLKAKACLAAQLSRYARKPKMDEQFASDFELRISEKLQLIQ